MVLINITEIIFSFLFNLDIILGMRYDEEEEPFLDSTGCNKMIMIVTDGATETAINVFQSRNWFPNNISTCHPIEVENQNEKISLIEFRSF